MKEYARITEMVIPVTALLLKPHIADMEFRFVAVPLKHAMICFP